MDAPSARREVRTRVALHSDNLEHMDDEAFLALPSGEANRGEGEEESRERGVGGWRGKEYDTPP